MKPLEMSTGPLTVRGRGPDFSVTLRDASAAAPPPTVYGFYPNRIRGVDR
jgi:hypothetical protein